MVCNGPPPGDGHRCSKPNWPLCIVLIFNSFSSCIACLLKATRMVVAHSTIWCPDEMRCMTMHRKIEFSKVKNAHLEMSGDIFGYVCMCVCVFVIPIRCDTMAQCALCSKWLDVESTPRTLTFTDIRWTSIVSHNGIHIFANDTAHKKRDGKRKQFGQHIYHFRVLNSILPINISLQYCFHFTVAKMADIVLRMGVCVRM